MIIWGNHSSTQYPDVNHGTVAGKPIREVVKDDAWLNGEFISTVQQRGAAIIKVSGSVGLPFDPAVSPFAFRLVAWDLPSGSYSIHPPIAPKIKVLNFLSWLTRAASH